MRDEYRFELVEISRLRPHEEVDESHLEDLEGQISRDGILLQPVMVEEKSMVILDGHHRVLALRRLGCAFVPSYLVDYSDSRIRVHPRRADIAVDKQSVVASGLSGRPYPPKTSRHEWPCLPSQRPVTLAMLRR